MKEHDGVKLFKTRNSHYKYYSNVAQPLTKEDFVRWLKILETLEHKRHDPKP